MTLPGHSSRVWLDAGQQHAVVDAGDDVYRWGDECIVILKIHQVRKLSIAWKELTDENGHLRLRKKYTMC